MITAITIITIITVIACTIAVAAHVATAPTGRPRAIAIALIVCVLALIACRAAHADHTTVTGYGVDAVSIEQVQSQLQALSEQRPSFVMQSSGNRHRLITLSTVREVRGNEPGLIIVRSVRRDRSREQRLQQEIAALKAQLAQAQREQQSREQAASHHLREADAQNAGLRRDLAAPRADLPKMTVAREQEAPTPQPQGWLIALTLGILILVLQPRLVRDITRRDPMTNAPHTATIVTTRTDEERDEERLSFTAQRVVAHLHEIGWSYIASHDPRRPTRMTVSDMVQESFSCGNHPQDWHPDAVDEWALDYARMLAVSEADAIDCLLCVLGYQVRTVGDDSAMYLWDSAMRLWYPYSPEDLIELKDGTTYSEWCAYYTPIGDGITDDQMEAA